jgi:hypothetical protein
MDIFNNIAEIREFMLFDRDDEACVSMICGHRESEYKLNGFATDLIEFGVVTVSMFKEMSGDLTMNYVLFVGTEKFDGVMSKNPFDGTFVVDIHKIVDCNANVVLQLDIGEWEKSYKLKSINKDWGIDSRDCIQILIKQYKDELKSLYDKKDWCAEVYIKIIDETDEYVSNFYFYVSVLGRRGETLSMVISPDTGDILASNSNIKKTA